MSNKNSKILDFFDRRDNDIDFMIMSEGNKIIIGDEKKLLVDLLVDNYKNGNTTFRCRNFIGCQECGGGMLEEDNKYIGRKVTACIIIVPGNDKRYLFDSECLHRAEKHELRVSEEKYEYLKEMFDFYLKNKD